MYLNPPIYALRPKLRLRMLSSSISVIDIVDAHFSDERFSRIVGRIGFSALVLDFNAAKDGDGDFGACVGAASTSTTLSTALPSSTRRTLSLSRDAEDRCKRSHSLIRLTLDDLPPCDDDAPPELDPENASQNALPSLPSTVCDATMAAAAASLCCFSS